MASAVKGIVQTAILDRPNKLHNHPKKLLILIPNQIQRARGKCNVEFRVHAAETVVRLGLEEAGCKKLNLTPEANS